MKMNVYLQSANHPKFQHLLHVFAKGVAAVDPDVEINITESLEVVEGNIDDVNVIWGSWKDRQDAHHRVKNSVVASTTPFIVLETPIVGRGPVKDVMDDTSYRIGVNGFLADTMDNYGRMSEDVTQQRVDCILATAGLTWDNVRVAWHKRLQYGRDVDAPIIIALQIPGDASLRGINITEWAYNSAIAVREKSDRPIIIRGPQLSREFDVKYLNMMQNISGLEFQRGTKENLIPTLLDAAYTVTHSSTLAVDSILNGTPAITTSPANFGHYLPPHLTFYSIKKSPLIVYPEFMTNLQTWLANLSWIQWTLEEIAEGQQWPHLKKCLTKRSK